MALVTKTINIGNAWVLVTDKISLVQFNDKMDIVVNNGDTPTGRTGIRVAPGEFYTNNGGLTLWAKGYLGGTGLESIRLIEEEDI